jgi:hypothetical protein
MVMNAAFNPLVAAGIAANPPGPNASWIGVLFAMALVATILRHYLRGTLLRRNRTPVAPNHPVILPSNRVAPQPDQSFRLALPIESIRELLGPAPRTFSQEIRKYLKVTPPPWLKRSWKDELKWAFRDQERIRRDGTVVWASIVQANSLLFRPGPTDSPASVIFSLDPWYDENPDDLLETAHDLFQLKGTDQNDPDAAAFARMLTNEMTRGMMLRAPKRFTGGRSVFHSSIMLTRKHLPKGFVGYSLLPVWLDPNGSGALLLVPAAYWPPSLTAQWDRPVRAARRPV